ncbi:hypothetical protein PHLGIDRAFT_19130 [Phlebiopsis gigantea 11061_1 CR5-6]|uniref:Secreted protein n=1 Tax=Phlebiopsis gigantea (strain 11061_1 CR5-6) TaxID=745531 RepID=A0A0C3RZ87_PHLG1|nr:hypothetical protein PHLGIDRAFT_19130 [Phlebiopsis gigantea 11061_1 CR5-6]
MHPAIYVWTIFAFFLTGTYAFAMPLQNTVVYPAPAATIVQRSVVDPITPAAQGLVVRESARCRKLRLRGVRTRTCAGHMTDNH